MALKILSQIGTDRGITSEGYLRIADYTLGKNGCYASFRLQLFMTEADSVTQPLTTAPYVPANKEARCQLIGESLYHSFQVETEVDTTCTRMIPTQVQKEQTSVVKDPVTGEDKTVTQTITVTEMVEESYPCKQKVVSCDFSSVQGVDIFSFGYTLLKEKMKGIFGAENVVDC